MADPLRLIILDCLQSNLQLNNNLQGLRIHLVESRAGLYIFNTIFIFQLSTDTKHGITRPNIIDRLYQLLFVVYRGIPFHARVKSLKPAKNTTLVNRVMPKHF